MFNWAHFKKKDLINFKKLYLTLQGCHTNPTTIHQVTSRCIEEQTWWSHSLNNLKLNSKINMVIRAVQPPKGKTRWHTNQNLCVCRSGSQRHFRVDHDYTRETFSRQYSEESRWAQWSSGLKTTSIFKHKICHFWKSCFHITSKSF